jgi:putative tryptophan/tyrosine transport system substrate-binding protein
VTAARGDPVAFGLVKSLSHPGGNVTGLATFAELLASKQIDLLRELMPHLAMLVDVSDPVHLPQLRETMAAATANGIALVPI